MSDAGKDDPVSNELLPGSTLESRQTIYIMVRVLSEKGSPAVFLVRDLSDLSAEFAMKVERRNTKSSESKLKRELAVLKALHRKDDKYSHLPLLIDRCTTSKFHFIVVELMGRSLADLRAMLPNKVFSMGTGLEVCRQELEGIADIHPNGFVHRDIRPSCFAIGRSFRDNRTVFIIDLGLARRFLNRKGAIISPRPLVGCKGAAKYASLNGHHRMELGPRDDCESWLYMLLDLIVPTGLPWQNFPGNEMGRVKEEVRSRRDELFKGLKCAAELGQILSYVDKLRFEDRVDYSFFFKSLKTAAEVSDVKLSDPFNWELPHHRKRKLTTAEPIVSTPPKSPKPSTSPVTNV